MLLINSKVSFKDQNLTLSFKNISKCNVIVETDALPDAVIDVATFEL
jgi:hypothetical protein